MQYKIVHNTAGRLRVRCGTYAFSDEQGYGISHMLMKKKYINNVIIQSANGSILIYYKEGFIEKVLEDISNIKREDIPFVKPSGEQAIQEIDNRFHKSFVKLIAKRAIFNLFLPKTLKMAITLFNASKYVRSGVKSLMSGHIDVAVLDAASITAAIAQGSHSTAGSVMFLLNVSGLLEEYTKERTKNALTNSIAINVDQVWLVTEDGKEVSMSMNKISVDDCIRIRTGSMIPVDGIVIDGNAMVNESAMTGEPLGRHKYTGTTVYAGTIVEEGAITVKVTALSNESRISKIVELIEESESLKAGVQSKAENLADSIVGFSFMGAIFTGLFTRNIMKAISVLMVDYSCAIKLSTPIAVISAMREASVHNIMVKGGKHLETFAKADTIVFDKTGTITNACPQVVHVEPFGEYTRDEVLRTAACIEEHFPHSIARAVVQKAKDEQLNHEEEHSEVEYIVAHGVATQLYGRKAIIGSSHFVFEDECTEITEEQKERIKEISNGSSLLYLAIGGKLAGVICINDPPRDEAKEAIDLLKKSGIKNIVMLTGDHENAAKAVSDEIGITEYKAQVLPEYKAEFINELKSQGRCVIMVGDGINDSPALATANVSVAMKDSSDLARDVADITLLSTDLRELAKLRILSKAMLKRIHNNYLFIINFNTMLLLGGLFGFMRPTTTALLHNTSTMAISAMSMKTYLK